MWVKVQVLYFAMTTVHITLAEKYRVCFLLIWNYRCFTNPSVINVSLISVQVHHKEGEVQKEETEHDENDRNREFHSTQFGFGQQRIKIARHPEPWGGYFKVWGQDWVWREWHFATIQFTWEGESTIIAGCHCFRERGAFTLEALGYSNLAPNFYARLQRHTMWRILKSAFA